MKPSNVRWYRRISLLLLPCLLLQVSIWLARERGPFWLGGNSDPSYQYLLNALLVTNGRPPCHVDHPGTTVQVLGAFVLRLTTLGHDEEQHTKAVLAAPERALAHLHHFFLGLTVATVLLAGLLVLERTRSLPTAWIVQLVPLLQVGTYRSTLFVDPEALLAPLTILFVAVLISREPLLQKEHQGRQVLLMNLALGFLAGAGVVTKVTFAPLCLLALLVQRSWRGVFWTAITITASAALCIAPAASQLPRIFQWFGRLATHTGTYGTGSSGFIDLDVYFSNLWKLATADRLLLVLVPIGLFVGSATLLLRSNDPAAIRRARLLCMAFVVQVLGLLLIAKHPHSRYLLPVALSTAFTAALLMECKLSHLAQLPRRWLLAGLGSATVGLAVLTGRDIAGQGRELRNARDSQLEHSARADRIAHDGIRVDYYRSSSMEYALHFGNSTAWRLYTRFLNELHPNRIFFNIWNGQFENFSRTLPPAQILKSKPVYLVGNGEIDRLPPGVRLPIAPDWEITLVDRIGAHTIHRLQPAR